VLREGARAHEVPDRLAVARQTRRSVGQVALVLLLADREAEVRAVVTAVHAVPALRREQRHHMVAGRDVLDAVADPLDDARTLVAEDGGGVTGRVGTGRRVEVGVADTAGDEPDQDLPGLGLGEVELLHLELRTELLEDGCADLHRRDCKPVRSRVARMAATGYGRQRQRDIYLGGLRGSRPRVPQNAAALERAAERAMSREGFAYVAGGAGLESTMKANREAFERVRIVPRMLRGPGT